MEEWVSITDPTLVFCYTMQIKLKLVFPFSTLPSAQSCLAHWVVLCALEASLVPRLLPSFLSPGSCPAFCRQAPPQLFVARLLPNFLSPGSSPAFCHQKAGEEPGNEATLAACVYIRHLQQPPVMITRNNPHSRHNYLEYKFNGITSAYNSKEVSWHHGKG